MNKKLFLMFICMSVYHAFGMPRRVSAPNYNAPPSGQSIQMSPYGPVFVLPGSESSVPNYRGSMSEPRSTRRRLNFDRESSADNHTEDNSGVSPIRNHLDLAVLSENLQRVIELLHQNADPNRPDHYSGAYPLHEAVQRLNPKIVEKLLDAGAQVNVQCNSGSTPLHRLFYSLLSLSSEEYKQKEHEIARMLMLYGGNPTILNKDGRSALNLMNDEDQYDPVLPNIFGQHGQLFQ